MVSEKIVAKGKKLAAHILEAAEDDIEFNVAEVLRTRHGVVHDAVRELQRRVSGAPPKATVSHQAQKMTRWNAPFEVEQIKQLTLIARLSPHHGKPPPLNASSRRNHCSPKIASPFSTPSTQLGNRAVRFCCDVKIPLLGLHPFNCYSVALGNCQAQSPNCHAGTCHPV
jgi:hypothetical protein